MGDDETEEFLLGHPTDSFGPTEIAKGTGRPKQTVHSHLTRLLKQKSVIRISKGKYGVLNATKSFYDNYLIVSKAVEKTARQGRAWFSKRYVRFVLLACGISFLSGLRAMQATGLATTVIPAAYLIMGTYGLTLALTLDFLPAILTKILLRILIQSFKGYA
jgi:hypothetical protein